MKNPFILDDGEWLGEGIISFSNSNEQLKFYTRWVIPPLHQEDKNGMEKSCIQEVEMVDAPEEKMCNQFHLSDISEEGFTIKLTNEQIGTVIGSGVIEPNKIAWEFRDHRLFEGFEVYELQENGEYQFHAEYISSEQYRSIINGRIWKKAYRE